MPTAIRIKRSLPPETGSGLSHVLSSFASGAPSLARLLKGAVLSNRIGAEGVLVTCTGEALDAGMGGTAGGGTGVFRTGSRGVTGVGTAGTTGAGAGACARR